MNLVQHPQIHKELFKRWAELGLKPTAVLQDAEERGVHIDASRLSEYKNMFKKKKKHYGSLTAEQLLWLCTRWQIYINVNIGTYIKEEKGKPVYEVKPYDELTAIRNLHVMYPQLKKSIKETK